MSSNRSAVGPLILIGMGGLFGYLALAIILTALGLGAVATSAISHLIVIGLYFILRSRLTWLQLPARRSPRPRPDILQIGVGLLILTITWWTSQNLAAWYNLVRPSQAFQENQELLAQTPVALVLITALILAPIGEEVFLRGFLYTLLRQPLAPWVAALISSIVFATIHGNPVQIIVTLPLGMILAAVYEYTGKLRYAIIGHAGFNLLALILTPVVLDQVVPALLSAMLLSGLIVQLYIMMSQSQLNNPEITPGR